MVESKGVKKQTLVKVYLDCALRNDFKFNNTLVKQLTGSEFSNQFDATKIDTSEGLPDELRERDVFIVHLGNGQHQFVRDIRSGYHMLEDVPDIAVHRGWTYRPGVLDGTDMSEAGVLSIAFNQQIIQEFLYDDRTRQVYINVPRRTRGKETNSFSYRIGDQVVDVLGLQIEMDFIVERNGEIALIEAKCSSGGLPKDFAVVQVYLPYRRLLKILEEKKTNPRIRSLFLLQYKKPDGLSALRLYEYTFVDPLDMGSIRLLKNAEYILEKKI